MENDYDFDEIERYLSNEMDEKELENFKQRLTSDKNFSDAVNLHQEVIVGLQSKGLDEFKSIIEDISNDLSQEGYYLSEDDFDTMILGEGDNDFQLKFNRRLESDEAFKKDYQLHQETIIEIKKLSLIHI